MDSIYRPLSSDSSTEDGLNIHCARVIGLSNQGIPMFNFLATIDKFDWSLNKNDDINYSIELNKFPEEFWQWARRDVQLLRRVGLLARNGFGDNINRRLNELRNRINTTIDNIFGL